MKNDFLDYNGLYSSPNLSHSSGPWKKHKYIKKINGVYYYGDKTELGQIKNKTDNAAKNKDKRNKLASQVDSLASKSETAANKLTKAKQKNTNPSNIITNVAESLAKNKLDKTNNAYEEKSKELKERVLSNYEDEKFVNDRTVKKQLTDKVNALKKSASEKASNVKDTIDREVKGASAQDKKQIVDNAKKELEEAKDRDKDFAKDVLDSANDIRVSKTKTAVNNVKESAKDTFDAAYKALTKPSREKKTREAVNEQVSKLDSLHNNLLHNPAVIGYFDNAKEVSVYSDMREKYGNRRSLDEYEQKIDDVIKTCEKAKECYSNIEKIMDENDVHYSLATKYGEDEFDMLYENALKSKKAFTDYKEQLAKTSTISKRKAR